MSPDLLFDFEHHAVYLIPLICNHALHLQGFSSMLRLFFISVSYRFSTLKISLKTQLSGFSLNVIPEV